MLLEPNTRLGRYEIRTQIGAGGMGEVYQARDPRLGRDVVTKPTPLDGTVAVIRARLPGDRTASGDLDEIESSGPRAH